MWHVGEQENRLRAKSEGKAVGGWYLYCLGDFGAQQQIEQNYRDMDR